MDDIEAPVVELFTEDFSEYNGQCLDNGVEGEKQKEEVPRVRLNFQFKD